MTKNYQGRMHDARVTLHDGHVVPAVEFLGRYFTKRGVEITRKVASVKA